jgi:acetyltransferase-like isoleucine patch superfamily enzyme
VQRPGTSWGKHPLIIAGAPATIGRNIPKSTYFNTACGVIKIDENVVMGEDVKFLTGMHLNVEDAIKQGLAHHAVPESGRDIHVERGCYIGSNAIVIGPIKIGEYSVIGAGAIVTRDIPSYSVVYGVAASVVRKLNA